MIGSKCQVTYKNFYRKHVRMDLQPYSCTFAGCSSVSVTFGNRAAWINHEMTHTSDFEWVCIEGCGELFLYRNYFMSYLEEKHFLTATHGPDFDFVVSRCQRQNSFLKSTIRVAHFVIYICRRKVGINM
jgi:hypothetical protein